MTIWRKRLQFINVMLANRSSMIVAERGSGRMTYAKKIKPFEEHDLRVTLQLAGNNPNTKQTAPCALERDFTCKITAVKSRH